MRAGLVVGADGRFSFVAGSVGSGEYNVVPPIWFPFYTYLRGVEGVDPPKLEILDSAQATGTIMLAPCDDGIWMIILYSEQSRFEEFRRDHERVFWERVTADPRLTDRLARAELIAPVRGRGDLVNYMRVPAGPGWALVGDSGQHKDPIYGQGIGDAVRTARLLADHVVEALGGEGSFESLPAAFHAARDADLLPQYEWMIKGAPQGWAKAEFQAFLATLGEDPELSRQFVNLFSHGVMPQELFGRQPDRPGERGADGIPRGSSLVTVEEKLRELGYELGVSPAPLGQYVRAVTTGSLVFVAGHGPFDRNGETAFRGQVGGSLSLEQGQEAARLCVLACLSSLRAEIGQLDRVTRIVKMLAFVSCAPGFSATSAVIDGASELLGAAFGERGRHARAAIGTSVLPYDIPVELELIAEIE